MLGHWLSPFLIDETNRNGFDVKHFQEFKNLQVSLKERQGPFTEYPKSIK
jgi:hypothetical protein